MEESDSLLWQMQKCIFENKLKTATSLIKKHKEDAEMPQILSGIIPFLITKAKEKNSCAEMLLFEFAEECDPEEVLLQLIDDIDNCNDDDNFVLLSRVLLRTLLRLPTKRLNSLSWGLNALESYLLKIDLPEIIELDEKDELLLDYNSDTERLLCLCSSLLSLYNNLIVTCSDDFDERRIVILKFTLQMLAQPLAFFDLKLDKCINIERKVSESLVNLIIELQWDIFSIIELDPSSNIGEIDIFAKAILFYLVLSENIAIEKLPKIYDNVYLFQHLLGLASELLQHENLFVQRNAIFLTKAIFDRVDKITLPYFLLDSCAHNSFCTSITYVIIYSRIKTHRVESLNLYRRYLFLFDTKGQYLLLYNLMKVLNHTNIIGYTITLFKDIMMQELGKLELSPYFKNDYLYCILNRCCFLPEDKDSIVDVTEQIVAFLNLIRFLIIRDKENVSGFKNYINALEKKYLNPLKIALNATRAHYHLRIRDVQNENAVGDSEDSKLSVTVAGTVLPEPSYKMKLDVLSLSLTSFDLMEDLVCRVNELNETM